MRERGPVSLVVFVMGCRASAGAPPARAAAQAAAPPLATTRPVPPDDGRAIDAVLATHQAAVGCKDRALFETLLLGKDIPFAFVPSHPREGGVAAWRDHERFRKGVFERPAFTQAFSDVHIRRHGALAGVDLTFGDAGAHGVSKAWKTMRLIRVAGRSKIASEFFTDSPAAKS